MWCFSFFGIKNWNQGFSWRALSVWRKKQEITQAQGKRLRTTEGLEILAMSWWGTCTYVFLFQFRRGERQQDEIFIEDRSLLNSGYLLVGTILMKRMLRPWDWFDMRLESRCWKISWVLIQNEGMGAIWREQLCKFLVQKSSWRLRFSV